MSNKNCGPDVVKYFIVEPSQGGVTGSTGDFLVCDGILFANTISGCTDTVNVNGTTFNGDGSVLFNSSLSACTSIHTSNIYGCYSGITLHTDIEPAIDDTLYLGTASRRFREVNTVSGTSTVWTSTDQIITPNLNLGLDLSGNTRIITAENSIIQDDILIGGDY